MLNLNDFEKRSELEIRRLHGGPKHDFKYFIAILEKRESDVIQTVIHAKLQYQRGSQRMPSYPRGYELFRTPYGLRNFCLATSQFPVPRLEFYSGAPTPTLTYVKMDACILKSPPARSDEYSILEREAERFKLMCRLRTQSASDAFPISLDLLAPGIKGLAVAKMQQGGQFEKRLGWAPYEKLADLAILLDMPRPLPPALAPAA